MGGLFGRGGGITTRTDRISDFQINSASYGEVVPVVLGTTRLSGNIIQWEDFTAHEHRTSQRVGKGGKKKATSISYTYTVAVAIGLCEGPIKRIGKVWLDKETYQYPNDKIGLTAYLGEVGQAPWPYVVSKHPDKALPYSGLCYMAGVVDMGERASLPTFNFEIQGQLLETGDGIDVNPADYIVHVLKSVGIEETAIDGIENFREYCKQADILISSPPETNTQKAQQIVSDIADICNCYLFWSNDRLKIVPLADKPIKTWEPRSQIQYDLTEDDFLSGSDGRLVEYKRKSNSESYNTATVEFINRANSYEKEAVTFEVLADVQRNGMKPAPSYSAHYIYTKARAMYLAEQLAMKRLYERNQYSFKLDWAFCRLEPGDLVTLTESTCGLHKQIVVITDVQEAQDGELQITAIGKPPGMYAPTKYDVHENERPFVDYNKPAQSILDATFIQPPADVVGQGQELWVGVSTPQEWGGCEVWMSDDPTANFQSMGMLNTTARIGKLVSPLSADGNSCIIRMVNGTLKSGTHIDAERGNTVCYINGECLSYETATLNADGTVTLNNLVRGQFNTPIGSHSAGDKLSRLDEAFMRIPYRKQDVGKKIYAKFTSLNNLGGQQEDISRVKQYEYTIQEYFIPEVSEFTLSNKYRQLGGKAIAYDLVAKFIPPNLKTLSTVVAWYREQGTREWIYGGDGNGQIVISQCEVGKTYDVKLQVKDINGNYSNGIVKSLQIALKSDKPNTPDGFTIRFAEQAIYNWREVTNADVDFYEVRLNTATGNDDGLLAKSSNTTASSLLQNRQSTVYLYAHNPVKGYSAPAMLEYNVPKPITPTDVTVKTTMNGLVVTYSPIPSGAHHANIYVNEQRYQSTANTIFIPIEAGVHKVKVAYVDIFGEGDTSDEQLATVKAEIPPELMKAQNDAIANIDARTKELDKAVQAIDNKVVQTVTNEVTGMSSRITALDNLINQKVQDVNNNVNSQITQLTNSIDLKVQNGINSISGDTLVSRINLSSEGTRIDGKLLHVTGRALFDDNIITSKMLQASAVTADKIKVDSLSSITANVGTLTGGTITGSTIIGTTIQNASGTFSVSSEGVIKGATIDAQSFRKSGFEITALKVENYTLRHGTPLPVPEGFNFEDCRYIILNIQRWVEVRYTKYAKDGWDFAERNVKINPDDKDILMTGAQHGIKRIGWAKHRGHDTDITTIRCGISKDKIVFATETYDDLAGPWPDGSGFKHYILREGFLNIMCIAARV
ncbi:phage tail protein [Veillonella sp. VA142]|uniref:phage tail protein n=1 Tax=Veillonella sp. VA142 TaxID=741834 RepID=UPI000F8E2FAF|nr:phage tail protein [Veillonella sp. VA142]